MEPNSPGGIVLGSLSAITTVLYVYVLYVILKHKELRGSAFYMLNLAMGVVDIGNIWTTYLFQRIPAIGVLVDEVYLKLGNYSIFAVMCTNGFGFFNSTQKYYLIAIGFNRFTAVVMPSVHRKVWSFKNTFIIVIIIGLLNLIQSVVMELVNPSFYQDHRGPEAPNEGLHCRNDNLVLQKINLQFNIYLSLVAAIVASIVYGIILLSLYANRKKMKTANDRTKRDYNVELKLTISVLLHTVLLTADSCTAVLIFLAKQRFLMAYSYIIQDLLSGCNPFLLLFFSSELRKKVFWWSRRINASNVSSVQLVPSFMDKSRISNRS